MFKAKCPLPLIFLLISGLSLAEEYPHPMPVMTDEKYQIEIARCNDEKVKEFTESLGFFDQLKMNDEKLGRKKQEISEGCNRNQRAVFRQDLDEYNKAKREFDVEQAKLERERQLQKEKEEAERVKAAESARQAALALAEAQEKEKKAAAEMAYAQENAWKTYALWGGGFSLFILWLVLSNIAEKKRNEQVSQRLEIDLATLDENIQSANRGLTVSFDNRDNISGYGSFLWSEYGCQVFGRKDVTKYKSMSAGYSRTGDRARESGKVKGRGRVSVSGTRGKYEKVDEQFSLGANNVYVTTEGLYLCGDYPIVIGKGSLVAFKIKNGNAIQVTFAGSKYPVEIQFSDWGRAKVCCAAMQII